MRSRLYYLLVIVYLGLVALDVATSFPLFGWRLFTLRENSMDPTISHNSLVVVKKQADYSPGDIIAFRTRNASAPPIVAHRIVQLGGNVYVTKGDANLFVDRFLVSPHEIIGRVVFALPYLGVLLTLTDHIFGVFIFVVLPALVIVGVEVIKLITPFRPHTA